GRPPEPGAHAGDLHRVLLVFPQSAAEVRGPEGALDGLRLVVLDLSRLRRAEGRGTGAGLGGERLLLPERLGSEGLLTEDLPPLLPEALLALLPEGILPVGLGAVGLGAEGFGLVGLRSEGLLAESRDQRPARLPLILPGRRPGLLPG